MGLRARTCSVFVAFVWSKRCESRSNLRSPARHGVPGHPPGATAREPAGASAAGRTPSCRRDGRRSARRSCASARRRREGALHRRARRPAGRIKSNAVASPAALARSAAHAVPVAGDRARAVPERVRSIGLRVEDLARRKRACRADCAGRATRDALQAGAVQVDADVPRPARIAPRHGGGRRKGSGEHPVRPGQPSRGVSAQFCGARLAPARAGQRHRDAASSALCRAAGSRPGSASGTPRAAGASARCFAAKLPRLSRRAHDRRCVGGFCQMTGARRPRSAAAPVRRCPAPCEQQRRWPAAGPGDCGIAPGSGADLPPIDVLHPARGRLPTPRMSHRSGSALLKVLPHALARPLPDLNYGLAALIP